MQTNYLPPNTDAYVKLAGLQNPIDSTYFNAATVGVVVKDTGGSTVVSSSALAYDSESTGGYEAVIDKDSFSSLVLGRSYVLIATAAQGGVDREFEFPFVFRHA